MDYSLLEQKRAFIQRIIEVEKSLRFLQKRVRFPGKVKYAQTPTVVTNNPTALAGFTALSLDLAPGTWTIEARSQMIAPQNVNMTMIAKGFDTGGNEIAELNDEFNLGYAEWLSSATTTFTVPASSFGVGTWPEGGRVDLTLHVSGGAAASVTWEHVWLSATPV